ncbi:MAG: PstS family phosphate ABC transporter substrate-binding protein [Cyanobacteria bacterium P01_H01_bin.26]
MQRQQDKVLLMITLVGLGLIGGVFGLVAWLIDGDSWTESTLPSGGNNNLSDSSVPLAEGQLGSVQQVPAGLFNYGGSTTWIPIHETVNRSIANAFPDFQLRYTLPSGDAPGSGSGIKMLLGGQLSFSESSRPLKPGEHDTAERSNFSLEQIPVAIDGIALAVNPELDIAGLDVEQIKAIYTGEITNWSDLGGPDLPIQAYSRSPEEAGTAQFFLDFVIDADTYGSNVSFVSDTTTGIRQVANEPGGIYYASAPEVVNQCSIYAIPVASQSRPNNFVRPYSGVWRTGGDCLEQANTINTAVFREGSYPLTRRLFVIVKADGASDEAAGRAYANMLLSPEGQTLIQQAGFVNVR